MELFCCFNAKKEIEKNIGLEEIRQEIHNEEILKMEMSKEIKKDIKS